MKKLCSLIRASMSSGMSLFKIKTKKGKASSFIIPSFVAIYLMFMVWAGANSLFEKLDPLGIEYLMLSIIVFGVSIMTIIEGIYKTSSLLFNCKDDQLLFSLPIKKTTILFIRILKFYIFELIYNSIFMLPVMIAYIRWGNNLGWTYYLTSFIMIITLPIIPIIISCIIGFLTTGLSSHFKYKNALQIILSMIFIIGVMLVSYNLNGIMNYLLDHADSINDVIIKLYYPAGIYAKLVIDFRLVDLLVYVLINIILIIVSIKVLSKVYFNINSRTKRVITKKASKVKKVVIEKKPKTISLIKKELNTFFKTPVFIINSGFSLVLFIIAVIYVVARFDSAMQFLTNSENGFGLSIELIMNNTSVIILMLIVITSYMTSITNSVISLEGRNINILKTLPIKPKTIMMSKIYACLVITTPILLIGDIILFIKFKIRIIEALLIAMLSILIPLVSHFIGILVNLKYPKLDYENSAEVVKQSASSFISVIIGIVLLMINIGIIFNAIDKTSSISILLITTVIYIFIDILLYFVLIKTGTKQFNKLSI